MARFKPYFCHGCGVMVTREPWPHLDRSLFDPPHVDSAPREATPVQPQRTVGHKEGKQMAADACFCGAEPMQPDWSAVTDRAWKQHTREACFDRPRPMGVADSEWAEIERVRAQRTTAPRTPAQEG